MLMNEILGATWIVLILSGVLVQVLSPIKNGRKLINQYASSVSAMLMVASVPFAFTAWDSKTGIAATVVVIYLFINSFVLGLWKFHPLRTRSQVVKSGIVLSLGLGAYGALDALDTVTNLNVAVVSLMLSVAIFLRTALRVHSSRVDLTDDKIIAKEPTVSMLVPARNETHALTKHLKSAIKSEYNRLEFLVADDCSQDDTAQIIRSFAHDGVRFVQGHAPSDSWIGKNRAYQLLAEHSSGDYLIFSGVDTRYGEQTISKIISHMSSQKLDMMSIMPCHEKLGLLSMVIQPIRYFLMLATATKKNPPVLSTVWIIRRSKLIKYGGFEAVENSIIPEQYFARKANDKGAYKFIIAGKGLGLSTYKKASSQYDTMTRYMYPLLRKNVANHAIFTLAVLLVVGYPALHVTISLFTEWTLVSGMFLSSLLLMLGAYVLIVRATYPARMLIYSPFYFFAGSLTVYAVSIYSVFMYELDKVIWKGRNVCYPVMMDDLHKSKK